MPGRCGAKLKFTDPPRYCKKYPMVGGNGRCERCGGKSPRPGILHPGYKTGKFSKYLPPNIAERVAESYNSPDLLSLRTESAILDARFTMLMERLHTGESGSLWKDLNDAWSDFQSANRRIRDCREGMQALSPDDPNADGRARKLQDQINAAQKAAADAMTNIGRLIGQGNKDEAAWRELIDLGHEAKELKQAEFQRLAQLRQLITAEEALTIVHALQVAIAEIVTDAKQRQEIGVRFMQIMPTRDLIARPGD